MSRVEATVIKRAIFGIMFNFKLLLQNFGNYIIMCQFKDYIRGI